jgi:hypothetical protein
LFDTIDEVAEILSRPLPDANRELGFAPARRSDVGRKITLLEALWERG